MKSKNEKSRFFELDGREYNHFGTYPYTKIFTKITIIFCFILSIIILILLVMGTIKPRGFDDENFIVPFCPSIFLLFVLIIFMLIESWIKNKRLFRIYGLFIYECVIIFMGLAIAVTLGFIAVLALLLICLVLLLFYYLPKYSSNKWLKVIVKDKNEIPIKGITIQLINPEWYTGYREGRHEYQTDENGIWYFSYDVIKVINHPVECKISTLNAQEFGYKDKKEKILIDPINNLTLYEFNLKPITRTKKKIKRK